MKTILVLTDFSINANYAAYYALELAQNLRAKLLVCNIYEAPAGEEMVDRTRWPLRACEENSIYDLGELVARLKTTLNKQEAGENFRPDIAQCSEEGLVELKLKDIMSKHDVLLAVISAHNRDSLTGFFGRDHAWDIIDNAEFPVMVVPCQAIFKPFKRIAFATVMNDTDVGVLESLSGLAKYSDSEILITNVTTNKKEEHNIKQFFNQCDYPKIFYRDIIGFNVVSCLKRLSKNIDVDLLAIVHRRRSFLQEIIGGSVTRKMAEHPDKPLLIYPCSVVGETLVVF